VNSADELLLEVSGLEVESRAKGLVQTLVARVDLDIRSGETVGIVGESGSGKSLTARSIAGLLPPTLHASGSVRFRGKELIGLRERQLRQFRGKHVAVLFQDPYTMLNPLLRVGNQVMETIHGPDGRRLRGDPASREVARRLAEVGLLPSVARRYPFELSGGMRQRVGIAAALASDPKLLIADEPTTALDVSTQKEILELLRSIQRRRKMGLILITHDLRVAFSMCDRIYVLYAGRVVEEAAAGALEEEPLHPYSVALLLAEPPLERRVTILASSSGRVPPPDEVTAMCAFAPRCLWAQPPCRQAAPPLRRIEGRSTACARITEIRSELALTRLSASTTDEPTLNHSTDRPASLLSIRHLRKSYGDVEVLRGVSLDIGAGESVGLVGESGSGKTTIARCLLGLTTPSSGRMTLGGIDADSPASLSAAERRRLRASVQMIFQDPYSSLNPARTVGATLREALHVVEREEAGSVGELLDLVGLPDSYARRKPAALSGGERQRVAIARAVAVRPRLIVCDEPVSSLDVTVQAQILDLFRTLRQELGVSYLFITHDLAVVRQVTERVYVLHRGEVVEEGRVDAVLDAPRDAYTRALIDSVPRTTPGWLNV
jgi:peptide/nickel transport system ATP-binding protein